MKLGRPGALFIWGRDAKGATAMFALMGVLTLSLALTLSVVSVSCTHTCTAMGCGPDGVVVEIRRSDGHRFEPGTYVFELVPQEGGTPFSTSCTLEVGGDDLLACPGYLSELWGFLHYEGDGFRLEMPWRWADGFVPTSVQVTVVKDGTQIGTQTITPDYEVWYPNGEECGPPCHSDSAEMVIDP